MHRYAPSMKPELDYAFLAEHAQVASGKLNVMGASFTHRIVGHLPSIETITVAGRVRAPKDTRGVEITLEFASPKGDSHYTIGASVDLVPGPDLRPYGDHVGLLFASTLQALIPVEGLYQVFITVDGEDARRLAFTVEAAGE